MATKRDLVEAHAFSRRRLVTAFVSGAPGGREVEPARPGRALVGGAALGVLMIAGAAIAGIFTDRAPSDWDSPGLVISKEQGAAYVILDEGEDEDTPPELRPVINITSAQLILGTERMEPRIIAQETLETRPLGDDIGILGAPASLPRPEDLLQSGWSACTGPDLGIAVRLGSAPEAAPVPDDLATLVTVERAERGGRAEPAFWLVGTAPATDTEPAQSYRYALTGPEGPTDSFLRAIGLNRADAVEVPPAWLALFPRGGDLDRTGFGVPDLGDRLDGDRAVGDYAAQDGGGVLVDGDGALQTLSPFAFALYESVVAQRADVRRRDRLEGPSASSDAAPSRWPQQVAGGVAGERCALLAAAPEERPLARLAGSPAPAASAADLAPGSIDVEVDPGSGAYVRSGDWGDTTSETAFAVDQKGRASALVGPETPALLGYAEVDAPLVPDTWVALFERGVPLSREAALCPPGREAEECG